MAVPLSLFETEYYAVVTVPAGARNIHVHELEISTSYLAVRDLTGKYHLTGDWTVDWPGTFVFGGAHFDYQRSFNRPESLYSSGPTNESLAFEVSFLFMSSSPCSLPSLVSAAELPATAWQADLGFSGIGSSGSSPPMF